MIIRPHTATFRYRVLDRVVVSDDDGTGSPVGFGWEPREFRTHEGAQKHQEKLAAQGHVAILQVGVLHWMPETHAIDEMTRIQGEGATLE